MLTKVFMSCDSQVMGMNVSNKLIEQVCYLMGIQLTEEMIKGLFSSTIYQRGHRYYANGRVRGFSF
ncbi:hypothetical protein NBRC111894_986 [Sporolactobacillus inulinus]|uniref:Uncharacterized protein n=1 Tax=Sporolactobacillus inulinus TaxID=2078 RepID=A0A4Y1Z8Q4_9BACL|nr:hypothetical protein NBRC111894_986 [Sporolactobacillus inulinus]